ETRTKRSRCPTAHVRLPQSERSPFAAPADVDGERRDHRRVRNQKVRGQRKVQPRPLPQTMKLFLILVLSGTCFSLSPSLRVTVHDPSGAVIANAEVTL